MIIEDKIYGTFELDGVLERLINCKEVQRLKYICQGGASYLVNKRWNVTRYEHSIGVMLLIKKLGGSLEEQIAGLLHDVSHTAFSHVIDYALDFNDEDYHEKIYDDIINNSNIPYILKKYGYDYKNILGNDEKYTLLEMKAPHLCADRIDYTLRDMNAYKGLEKEDIYKFLNSLCIKNNIIAIDNINASKWFVDLYCKEVLEYFMNHLNVYGYYILASAIKIGINENILDLDDLLKTDKEVLHILERSNNKGIEILLKKLKSEVILIEDRENFDIHQKFKPRLVDPDVVINNELYKSSDICDDIKTMNKIAHNKIREGVYLKVIYKK